MNQYFSGLIKLTDSRRCSVLITLATTGILFYALPALAHHPLGGKTPSNFIDGFLSGLGHPIIGLDHLVFVIASAILATALSHGLIIPISFVVASILGTGIHLLSIDLPIPEFIIATSILIFGILLAKKEIPNINLVLGLAIISGIFHGFAYGESIFGAEMGPLVAYLLGFSSIQLIIASAAYWGSKTLVDKYNASNLALRFSGFVICGVGGTFLSNLILESIFPA